MCFVAIQFLFSVAVSEEDSIMYYTEPGTSWATFNNNTFVPLFADEHSQWNWTSDSFRDLAYETCGNDTACLIDVFITGNPAIGASTKATAEKSVTTNAELSRCLHFFMNCLLLHK